MLKVGFDVPAIILVKVGALTEASGVNKLLILVLIPFPLLELDELVDDPFPLMVPDAPPDDTEDLENTGSKMV